MQINQSNNRFLGPEFAYSWFYGTLSGALLLIWPSAWIEPWERGFEISGRRLTFGWLHMRLGVQWGKSKNKTEEVGAEEKSVADFLAWASVTLSKEWSAGKVRGWLSSQPHLRKIIELTKGQPYYARILLAREFESANEGAAKISKQAPKNEESSWLDRLDRLGENLAPRSGERDKQ
jgi:hypothetical protein